MTPTLICLDPPIGDTKENRATMRALHHHHIAILARDKKTYIVNWPVAVILKSGRGIGKIRYARILEWAKLSGQDMTPRCPCCGQAITGKEKE